MTERILIVEDHADIAAALAEHLGIEGFSVTVAHSAEEGLAIFDTTAPSLVILDLMLPGMTGQAMLRTLRADGFTGPVLILSARDSEVDKVHGFRIGADDYVTKPFGLLELLARVHALLRRARPADRAPAAAAQTLTHGHVTFDLAAHRVTVAGREISMRPKERELLFTLLDHAGETVTRARLLRDVWNYAPGVDSRTVDWHVAALRRKLGDDSDEPVLIRTIRKVGYQMVLNPKS